MPATFGNDFTAVKRVALVGLAIGATVTVGTLLAVGLPASDRAVWVVLLALGPAAVLCAAVGITTASRVRLTEQSIQHVLLGRFVLSELPLVEFRRVQRIPPGLIFEGGKRMRLLGMHLGLLGKLESSIRAMQRLSSNSTMERGARKGSARPSS